MGYSAAPHGTTIWDGEKFVIVDPDGAYCATAGSLSGLIPWVTGYAGLVDRRDSMKLAITAAMLLLTTPTLCWAPSASAITGDEMCKAMHWPMPLPPTVGWSLEHTGYDTVFQCFDNVTAIAPDGHDTMNDPARDAYSWKVTSMTPPAGTMVPMNQKIQLTVVRDYSAPS